MKHLDTDLRPLARLQLCSLSGGSSSSSSQPVLNPQLFSLLNANAQRAAGVANTPFQGYGDQMTAGMTPTQQMAGSMLTSGAMNAGAGALQGGVNAAQSATGYVAPNISAPTGSATNAQAGQVGNPATSAGFNPVTASQSGSYNPVSAQTGLGSLSSYMNPYTNDVVNASMNDLSRARDQAITGNQSQATLSGAYGGSRHGVVDSLTNRDYMTQAANTSANLRNQGFNTAAGLLQNDNQAVNNMSQFNASNGLQNNQFNANAQNNASQFNAQNGMANNQFNAGVLNNAAQFNAGNTQQANLANAGAQNQFGLQNMQNAYAAQAANQNASLQGQGINLQGAGLLGTLGNSQSNNFLNSANAINAYGGQEQQTQQSALTAAYNEFMRQQGWDAQQQQILNQSLGLVPAAMGNSSQQSGSQFGIQSPFSFSGKM